MSPLLLAALGAVILAGAFTLRSTGMGFSLVAAPFLVLVLGPFEGILVANCCSVASSLLNLTQVHAAVDWRQARWLIPAGVLGVIPGALAVRALPLPILAIVVSVIVLVALAFTVLARSLHLPSSPVVAGVGGFASGFMNVTAGVAGPGLVVYAVATRWQHRQFAATAQVHFAVLSLTSLVLKGTVPRLPWAGWLTIAPALAAGLVLGNLMARRIDAAVAMRLVIVIAGVGAVAVLVRAILTL
ncbi:MAG: sulfite exporter TauE/SafE family protein [Propionibacteriaceae bacterium]